MKDVVKIVWDEATGTVYWKEGDEIAFAPMLVDNTCILDDGGTVTDWVSPDVQKRIEDLLR